MDIEFMRTIAHSNIALESVTKRTLLAAAQAQEERYLDQQTSENTTRR
jgi:hypothetical protein